VIKANDNLEATSLEPRRLLGIFSRELSAVAMGTRVTSRDILCGLLTQPHPGPCSCLLELHIINRPLWCLPWSPESRLISPLDVIYVCGALERKDSTARLSLAFLPTFLSKFLFISFLCALEGFTFGILIIWDYRYRYCCNSISGKLWTIVWMF